MLMVIMMMIGITVTRYTIKIIYPKHSNERGRKKREKKRKTKDNIRITRKYRK